VNFDSSLRPTYFLVGYSIVVFIETQKTVCLVFTTSYLTLDQEEAQQCMVYHVCHYYALRKQTLVPEVDRGDGSLVIIFHEL
jgi:hypothetical protein